MVVVVVVVANNDLNIAASLSSMTAVTLYNEGERKAELEVREREEEKGLVFTVDHNNFLPCLTVSLAGDHAGTRIQYKPV